MLSDEAKNKQVEQTEPPITSQACTAIPPTHLELLHGLGVGVVVAVGLVAPPSGLLCLCHSLVQNFDPQLSVQMLGERRNRNHPRSTKAESEDNRAARTARPSTRMPRRRGKGEHHHHHPHAIAGVSVAHTPSRTPALRHKHPNERDDGRSELSAFKRATPVPDWLEVLVGGVCLSSAAWNAKSA